MRLQRSRSQRRRADDIREAVRERYAAAATAVAPGRARERRRAAAAPSLDRRRKEVFGAALYDDAERDALPDAAKLASLGCGNPTAVAELHEGETVLDLGSGGGIDVLLSARRVGAGRQGLRSGHDR